MKELYSISGKLDYSLQITFGVSQEMGLLFAKVEDAIPMYTALGEDVAEVSLYVDRHHKNKFEPLLGRITHISKGTYDIYNVNAEELMVEFEHFKKIASIPSVVPGGFYLKNGMVYADFRFHHSSLDYVNQAIRGIVAARNKIRLSYLGSSSGLVHTLLGIDQRIPLVMVKFTYRPEKEYLSKDDLANGPVAEVKLFAYGMTSEYDMVYYATRSVSAEVPVDLSGGIYEAKFRTKFMPDLMKRIRKNKIPVASIVGMFHEDTIENFLFVPYFIADEMLELMFDTATETGTDSLNITGYENVSDYQGHGL